MTTAELPWMLLDVDGVLSPLGRSSGAWRDWFQAPGTECDLRLSLTLASAVADLPAERVWLTSWRHDANRVVAPALGWQPLEVVEVAGDLDRPPSPGERWAKLDALEVWFADRPLRPFVWIDDDMDTYRRDVTQLLSALKVPYLTVCPRRTVGLKLSQLREIRGWLLEHTSQVTPRT